MLGVAVWRKVQTQPTIASESTNREIICMYKDVKKTKSIMIYMEALALQTGAPKVNWEDIKSCISIVEYKIVTTRVKHIKIPLYFIQE